MSYWSGEPTQVYPGVDFFPADRTATVEKVSQLEGDARIDELETSEIDVRIAGVNEGFSAFSSRLQRFAMVLDIEIRCWFISPLPSFRSVPYKSSPGARKVQTDFSTTDISPKGPSQYWVQVLSPLSKELRDALVS